MPYEELTAEYMVPVSLETGAILEGDLRPSSDTPTHLELYRAFHSAGAIVHTHSEYATAFAQAQRPICCMGTTHADYFRADVPVTRPMTRDEVEHDYEKNTGLVIVEALRAAGLSPEQMPAVLVANHGPFTWGADASKALEHAEVLEYVARLEWRARALNPARPVLVWLHEPRKRWQHRQGQIVNAEITQVFKGIRRRRHPRTAQPRDDNYIGPDLVFNLFSSFSHL